MVRLAPALVASALAACLVACGQIPSASRRAPTASAIQRTPRPTKTELVPTARSTSVVTRTTDPIKVSPAPTASATPVPTSPIVGPKYRAGYNPLTGLPVSDLKTLFVAPLLVAISEFPPSARPQAGLSAAAQVWETSIGQGMSRFLAVYYGDYLEDLTQMVEDHHSMELEDAAIGPIRSGRVGYEEIKRFYPKALLITRSASPEVFEQLTNQITVYADDPNDVNSATLSLRELQKLEISASEPTSYAELVFDSAPPRGGEPAASLDIIFNLYNQIRWDYDADLGAYVRSQDQADGAGSLQPSLDRLNGARLQAENVVVLFAQHKFENLSGTILSIELAYVPLRNGLLFRDGVMHEINWSTRKLEFRLEDQDGEILPLKPGTTFFQVLSYETTWDEEQRLLRFHNPPLPTLTPTPSRTPVPEPSNTEIPTSTPSP